jgi:hydrogenase/urease accessory protein HupE
MLCFTPSRLVGTASALLLAGLVSAAQAHPGHSGQGPAHAEMGFFEALLHFLTQPDHAPLLVGVLGVGVLLARRLLGRRQK